MSSVTERPYLSIGEVLGLLLEEFPDVTISKIRFLESQGLIDPERTPSGYRKFYDVDVERLRVILREQRENFLPLKVIRRRLETGEIDDPSGGFTPPRGIRNVPFDGDQSAGYQRPVEVEVPVVVPEPVAAEERVENHADPTPSGGMMDPTGEMAPLEVPSASGSLSAAEVCRRCDVTDAQLKELESFGLIEARRGRTGYTAGDVAIVQACAGFLGRGIEGRHLRGWKQAADREASLFEQLVTPYLRQRNPQSRHEAVSTLHELARLGGELRAALLHAALQHHLDQ